MIHPSNATCTLSACVWDAAAGNSIAEMKIDHENIRSAVFDPHGHKILTTSASGPARIWNADTGVMLAELAQGGAVVRATFDSTGQVVLTASGKGGACIWDSVTGNLLGTLQSRDENVSAVITDPAGFRALTISSDGIVRRWDLATSSLLTVLFDLKLGHDASREFPSGTLHYPRLLFSRDGMLIASANLAFSGFWRPRNDINDVPCGDREVRVWDLKQGRECALLRHESSLLDFSFSSDRKIVTTCSTRGITEGPIFPHGAGDNGCVAQVWNITSPAEPIAVLKGHRSRILSVRFNPEGTRVVSASEDRTVRLWDAATGEQISAIFAKDGVEGAEFSASGDRILSLSMGSCSVWSFGE